MTDQTTSSDGAGGLYDKYEVRKDGEPVEDCFVLEPAADSAAREALIRYAAETDDEELAEDLRDWVTEICTQGAAGRSPASRAQQRETEGGEVIIKNVDDRTFEAIHDALEGAVNPQVIRRVSGESKVYWCGGCDCIFAERAAETPDDEDRCPFCGTPTTYEETEVQTVAF